MIHECFVAALTV